MKFGVKMSRSDKNRYTGLAKNLAVAYGSYSFGVSAAYYENPYFVNEGELGEFWFELAKKLNHVMDDNLVNALNDIGRSRK